ncbi:hypothetical protein OEZ66_24515, partial [Escherichia coli]|nr:hypothetical protein [Escherichia coli]
AAAPCTLPYDDGQSSPVADISPHLIVLISAFPISSQEKSYFSSTIKCGPFGRSRLHLMSLTLSASSILKFAMQNSRKNSQKKVPFVKKN